MGQIKAEAPEAVRFEDMEKKLVEDAMARGADAILIGELKTVEMGSISSASGKTYGDPHYYLDDNMKLKKKGGSDHYSQVSTTTIVKDYVIVMPNCSNINSKSSIIARLWISPTYMNNYVF
jgi:hypothetical protein